jgi:hypothetical protein
VHSDALVCRGCGAEIVRGASKRERAIVGWLATICGALAVVALLFSHPPFLNNNRQFLIILGLPLACLVFHILGRGIARLTMRSKLRFFRSYDHR